MTNEEIQLLLQDLSARLPYGVKVMDLDGWVFTVKGIDGDSPLVEEYNRFGNSYNTVGCGWTPYLRPMSSMTEKEKEEYYNTMDKETQRNYPNSCDFSESIYHSKTVKTFDWLNKHHFDYRGLISMGLAIAVTDDNNPYKV